MDNLYKDIFFDLDRTLWDFDRNSSECLTELFHQYDLAKKLKTDSDTFANSWAKANDLAWIEYRNGNKSKDEIRSMRFELAFKEFNYQNTKLISNISFEYVKTCPFKTHLISNTKDVLKYLHAKYNLHIVTNGFAESQKIKMEHSGLNKFFKSVTISDEVNLRKPQRKMFEVSLSAANAQAASSIMIGDDLMKDILGAKKVKMDQIFYNPKALKKGKIKPTYTISNLLEIKAIL